MIHQCVLTLIVCSVSIAVAQEEDKCPYPPNKWCSSDEIAKKCGVYIHCQQLQKTEGIDESLVEVTLYYESLCPYSIAFIKGPLAEAFTKVGDVMNLTMVPYGNARESRVNGSGLWHFKCQHGTQECIGNLIHTCSIYTTQNVSEYFPYIKCMATFASKLYPSSAASLCARFYNVNYPEIVKCTNSKLGNELEHEMALQTATQKSRNGVPWLTINGIHFTGKDLSSAICGAYKGTQLQTCKPEAEMLG